MCGQILTAHKHGINGTIPQGLKTRVRVNKQQCTEQEYKTFNKSETKWCFPCEVHSNGQDVSILANSVLTNYFLLLIC